MKRLEVSGAVRPLYGSLGVKGLKEMTTTISDFMKITHGIVVVTFYSHDAMCDKFQPAERSVSVSLVS